MLTSSDLIAFEAEVAKHYEAGEIHGPVHFSGGNEDQLIEVFKNIKTTDWVFSTYRSHYHALLHGVPSGKVMAQIMAGRSMNLSFPEHRFFTSAIVGGCLPIATGVALAQKRLGADVKVCCFVGDMAASGGAFHEATLFCRGHALPIEFIVEDNFMSCDSPTIDCWGTSARISGVTGYKYVRTYPHCGTGTYVNF